MNIRISFLGKENLVRGFNGLVRYAGNLKPIFTEIHKDFMKMEKENFDSVGKPKKFKALSRVYRARKSKLAPGQPIMQLSGDLKRSLTDRGKGHIFEEISPSKYRMGTSIVYAHRHQVGYKMPQRKIIQATPERKKSWAGFIHRFLVKGVKERLRGK
jgi:phage gpG-like protein